MVQPRGMCIVVVFSSLCISPSLSPGVNSKISMNLECALAAERTRVSGASLVVQTRDSGVC